MGLTGACSTLKIKVEQGGAVEHCDPCSTTSPPKGGVRVVERPGRRFGRWSRARLGGNG